MNGKQIQQQIKEKYPTLDVDYNELRNRIIVYGFHTLKENANDAKKELAEMGFSLGPNQGQLQL